MSRSPEYTQGKRAGMTTKLKTDLRRIAQLIAELQAIDKAFVGLDSWRNRHAMLKVSGVTEQDIGRETQFVVPLETARDILIEQRRGIVGLLKMHGLDVE